MIESRNKSYQVKKQRPKKIVEQDIPIKKEGGELSIS